MSLPVTFAASSWLWTSPFSTETIEILLPKVASMGFDAIEIALEDPALVDVQVLKKALQQHQLKAVVCGAFGPSRDLTNEDSTIRRNGMNYIEQCLDFCAELGVDFFAGPMYAAVGKARQLPAEKRKAEWELAVHQLRDVCEMASARGLQIALEPLNRFESDLVNTASDVKRLISDISHLAAKIVLDGFHMNIEERDVEAAIVTAGKDLIHLQVSENYRGTPGTGQSNWASYRRGLERIGYTGTVSIESFTTDNKELAGAVCFWHPMADSQDQLATDGLRFLKQWAS
jgi:D-psicose/D-tagatose/L-ribulose 3-epimerase